MTDESVYFHLKTTDFDWNELADIKNYKVGVTIGFQQEKIYKEVGIKADPVASEDNNFKKIAAGRIDVYETSKVVGYSAIKRLFDAETASKFTHHPKAINTNPYFVLFSKNTPNGKMYSEKFDSGMQKLIDSGEYDKILTQFLGTTN